MPTRPPPPLRTPATKQPIKKAAALHYEQGKATAPTLTAKGRGVLAEKIVAAAREHNIPITQDADLIEILDKVEIDTEIPLEVYAVVADIFAWVYKLNQKKAAA
jgi:flagellar biosynthesis protein